MSAVAHIPRPTVRIAPPITRALATAIAAVGVAVWATSVLFVVESVPAEQAVERGTVHALVVGVPLRRRDLRAAAAATHAVRRVAADVRVRLVADGAGRVLGERAVQHRARGGLAGLPEPDLPRARLPASASWRPGLDRVLFRALNVLLVVLFVGSALVVEAYPEHTPWAACAGRLPGERVHAPRPRAGGGVELHPAAARAAHRRAVRGRAGLDVVALASRDAPPARGGVARDASRSASRSSCSRRSSSLAGPRT